MVRSALQVALWSAVALFGVEGVSSAEPARAPAPPELSLGAATALAAGRTICVNAHVQDVGWQGWFCGSDGAVVVVGTTGQSRRLEALAFETSGTGGVCANAHVQDVGWQGAVCGADGSVVVVGTTGQSLRMEALQIWTPGASTCANAHVQDVGWQGWFCGSPGFAVTVGTTGQSRRMEALALQVF